MTGPIPFRVQPTQSPYQTLFSAIVHQQLAPRAAATILERVKAIHGEGTIPEPTVLLDTPTRLLRDAGLSTSKTAAVQDLAVKTLDGTVPSSKEIVTLRDEEIINRLTSIYGIGRWTVQMLLIFNLGRIDVLAVDDFALMARAGDLYGMKQPPTPKQLLQMGELWRPYRTVASLYLWNWKGEKKG
jgi:3-methyladenine DNA glycosylase/8-oxoguanine DNA glycosylase